MNVGTAFNLGMATNATEIEPDNAVGKRSDDYSTKKLENLTYETASGDIKIDNEDTSSNKEMTTCQTENKKSTDLRNIEATDAVKCEGLNFKGVTDVIRPDDNKDTAGNTVFNSGVNRISEINSTAYKFDMRDLKTEHYTSEANPDDIKCSVDNKITSFTGLSLGATPISSEENIDTARGISFTTSINECRKFSLGQSAEFAINETDYSDSNSEKDSMSKTNFSLKSKEESFCGEKAIIAFGNQNATDTLKIKNLNLETSFDSSKHIDDEDSMSDTKINRGLILTSLGENKTFDLVNSTVSNIKQPENSPSISAVKYVDPDVDKDTTYSGFNLVTQENASGKISDPTFENSSTINNVKLGDYTSTIAVNDISNAKDKTFKKEIISGTSSEKNTSVPFSDLSGKYPWKLEALETNGKSSDDDKTVFNKDTISNSERSNFRLNFGLRSNSSGEKSVSDSKYSSTSSNKESGNIFPKLDSDYVKLGTNKNSTSITGFSFGIKSTLLEEKSAVDFENSVASDGVEPKKSSFVSDVNNSSTSSTKEDVNLVSRLASDGAKPDTNKSTTPNFKFNFGIKPTLLSEKSSIALENSAASNANSSLLSNEKNSSSPNTKEGGNLFSTLTSDGTKPYANKSTTPNFKFNFGIKPTLLSEKSSIALENSAVSNDVKPKSSSFVSYGKNALTLSTKEDGSLLSTFASDGAKSDTNKSTTPNFYLSFGKNPTSLDEKSPALYAVEPKISLFASDAKNLSASSTKEHGSIFPSNDAKPDINKNVSPNSNFNFGIKPALFTEKSAISFKNLADSNDIESKSLSLVSNEKSSLTLSAKEGGNLFSTLASDGAKSDENKSTTPNFNLNFGIKPALFPEKSAVGLGNSAALSTLEPKSLSFASGVQNFPTSSTKTFNSPFSKLASHDAKTDLNKNTTHKFEFELGPPYSFYGHGPRRSRKAVRKMTKGKASGNTSTGFTFESINANKKPQEKMFGNTSTNFTFGTINSDEKSLEKTPGTTSTLFTFGSMNASEKSQEKTSGSTSTGFTFTFSYPKFQGKTSGITSTGFTFGSFDPKSIGPGTPLKFSPAIGTDTAMIGGVSKNISTTHQYITSMKGYLSKSFEELRFEDYKWSEKVWNSTDSILEKGGLSFLNSNSAFENTDTTWSNLTFDETGTAGVSELLKGLEDLLLSGKHSDVTLTVQDKEFKVHRVILGIRSPVFSAMMEHETKEKATGVVNIPDCDPDPFFDFLYFLYTGSTKKINANNVLDLYTIADKYQVPELCKICVNYMKSSITLQNFCDMLTLSLRHHERELTDVATQFFLKNSTEIALTVSWSLFVKENPVAANELFLKALNLYKK